MPHTPPTLQSTDPAFDPRDAAWPGWIGGLSIAFAGLGLLGLCCTSLGLASGPIVARVAGLEMPAPPRLVLIVTLLGMVLGLGLSVVLVLGGIGTLRNRSGGPRMLLAYATASIVISILLLPLNILAVPPGAKWGSEIAHAQLDAVEKAGGKVTPAEREAATAQREPTALNYAGTIVTSVLGIGYPAFLSVYLRRGRVRELWESWPR